MSTGEMTKADASAPTAPVIRELLEQVSKRNQRLVWLVSEQEHLGRRLAEKEQAVESLAAQLAWKDRRLQALTAQQEQHETAIAFLQKELAGLQSYREALALGQTETLRIQRELERWQQDLDECQKALKDREERAAWLQADLVECRQKGQQQEQGIAWLQGELADCRQRIHQQEQGIFWLQGELAQARLELSWMKTSKFWLLRDAYRAVRGGIKKGAKKVLPGPVKRALKRVIRGRHAGLVTLNQGEQPAPLPISNSAGSQAAIKHEPGDNYQWLTLLPSLREEEVPGILNARPPATALRRPDIICFSIIDWSFRYQRPQQIMSQFAAHGHRVFYINVGQFLTPTATPKINVRTIKENVYEISLTAYRQPDIYGEVIDGKNQDALLAALDELRHTYGIDEAIGYVMIASWGSVALEARQRWGWKIIYDCMDEWENFPGIKKTILNMETQLVQSCDLLVVTAQRLYDKWQKYNRPMVLARNAADYPFYAQRCHPNGILGEIKHPVIGYYGAIADWFDIELMTYIAEQRPDYTFVLLGGIFDVDVSKLKALPNVRVLGQQPYETMPQYLYHFDVCIIPFKINPITEATDPVKLYEYFSGGKPVVSVALPEIQPYREYLYVGENKEDFLAKLDAAVAEDDREMVARRKKLARQHTWEERYQRIEAEYAGIVPRASIVVVTYNNLPLTKMSLESIIRNTEYSNYEVVIVDNNSTDGTQAYLRYVANQYPHLAIILNAQNHGFAKANNQGIARATGDYLVLLNNDTIVPPGWLSRLLRHLRDPAIGLVGPVTNFVGNEAKINVTYRTWAEMEAFAKEHTWAHEDQIADIHMLAMYCVAMRRETYEQIGPLDEQFGIGMFEDDDYSVRMKKHGYRVVCALDVFIHHFGQAAFGKLIKTGDYNPLFEENRKRYEAKWNVKWVPHKHAPLKPSRTTVPPLAA